MVEKTSDLPPSHVFNSPSTKYCVQCMGCSNPILVSALVVTMVSITILFYSFSLKLNIIILNTRISGIYFGYESDLREAEENQYI